MESMLVGAILLFGAIAVLGLAVVCIMAAKMLLEIAKMMDELRNKQ